MLSDPPLTEKSQADFIDVIICPACRLLNCEVNDYM